MTTVTVYPLEVAARCQKAGLTAAETETLALVASGVDNDSIADQLAVAETTVRSRLTIIFEKIGQRGTKSQHTGVRLRAALWFHGLLPEQQEGKR